MLKYSLILFFGFQAFTQNIPDSIRRSVIELNRNVFAVAISNNHYLCFYESGDLSGKLTEGYTFAKENFQSKDAFCIIKGRVNNHIFVAQAVNLNVATSFCKPSSIADMGEKIYSISTRKSNYPVDINRINYLYEWEGEKIVNLSNNHLNQSGLLFDSQGQFIGHSFRNLNNEARFRLFTESEIKLIEKLVEEDLKSNDQEKFLPFLNAFDLNVAAVNQEDATVFLRIGRGQSVFLIDLDSFKIKEYKGMTTQRGLISRPFTLNIFNNKLITLDDARNYKKLIVSELESGKVLNELSFKGDYTVSGDSRFILLTPVPEGTFKDVILFDLKTFKALKKLPLKERIFQKEWDSANSCFYLSLGNKAFNISLTGEVTSRKDNSLSSIPYGDIYSPDRKFILREEQLNTPKVQKYFIKVTNRLTNNVGLIETGFSYKEFRFTSDKELLFVTEKGFRTKKINLDSLLSYSFGPMRMNNYNEFINSVNKTPSLLLQTNKFVYKYDAANQMKIALPDFGRKGKINYALQESTSIFKIDSGNLLFNPKNHKIPKEVKLTVDAFNESVFLFSFSIMLIKND